MVLVCRRESGRADERFRRRKGCEGHDLLRPGPGIRGGMGLFLKGGNRAAEAEDVGDPEEGFALFREA